jgi:hypothetical protein
MLLHRLGLRVVLSRGKSLLRHSLFGLLAWFIIGREFIVIHSADGKDESGGDEGGPEIQNGTQDYCVVRDKYILVQ